MLVINMEVEKELDCQGVSLPMRLPGASKDD
jgi:hypothetical protein